MTLVVGIEQETFENRSANICLLAGSLGQNAGIRTLHGVRVFVSLVAVMLNCLLLLALIRHKALHFNLRFLLINTSISISFQRLLASVWSLEFLVKSSLFATQDPCRLVMSTFDCWLRRVPSNWFNYSILLSMMAIAVERGYATVKFKSYEKMKSAIPCLILITIKVGSIY